MERKPMFVHKDKCWKIFFLIFGIFQIKGLKPNCHTLCMRIPDYKELIFLAFINDSQLNFFGYVSFLFLIVFWRRINFPMQIGDLFWIRIVNRISDCWRRWKSSIAIFTRIRKFSPLLDVKILWSWLVASLYFFDIFKCDRKILWVLVYIVCSYTNHGHYC